MNNPSNPKPTNCKHQCKPALLAIALLAVLAANAAQTIAHAGQRPISDFLSQQGTYCLGTDGNGNAICGGFPGNCFLYIPPFPNFLDFTDPVAGTSVSFDYANLFNAYLGNPFGTTTSGSINEVMHSDGTVTDYIVLHTVNAVTWASVGFSGTGTVLFGANEPQVAAGATPSLGSCTLSLAINGPAPGQGLPDLIAMLNGCGPWTFGSIGFTGQASGTLADGSPGACHVIQTGLITTAGLADPNSRVALDAFPAEHITIQAAGK